jgi:nicotinate-nucleotide pyrophosphorylase (carboxylating)
MTDHNETLDEALARNVRDALAEDVGRADWTALLVPAHKRVQARVVAKEPAVLCGRRWFDHCIHALDAQASVQWLAAEGGPVVAGMEVCRIGSALNFLQMLSAVATTTRAYADAIAGLSPNPNGCAILDTRKTLPGLRQAQKYAVRVGGGQNQRLALWDGILIKENHIAAAGGIRAALDAASELNAGVPVQIEVESIAELEEALACGAVSVLLDDFSLGDMHRAYAITQRRALLEASGSVDLERVRDIARTGVDRISIGKLTKDVRAIDLSMRVDTPS